MEGSFQKKLATFIFLFFFFFILTSLSRPFRPDAQSSDENFVSSWREARRNSYLSHGRVVADCLPRGRAASCTLLRVIDRSTWFLSIFRVDAIDGHALIRRYSWLFHYVTKLHESFSADRSSITDLEVVIKLFGRAGNSTTATVTSNWFVRDSRSHG